MCDDGEGAKVMGMKGFLIGIPGDAEGLGESCGIDSSRGLGVEDEVEDQMTSDRCCNGR